MTPPLSFDLIHEPWLPCIQADGSTIDLSLYEALAKAHTLQAIQGESPLVTAALHRLLLAILHRIYGPKKRRVWQTLWQKKHWPQDKLEHYFEQWHTRFNLFDATYPFYQVVNPSGKPKSLNNLVLEWATGNNATLFDHTTDQNIPIITAPQAARLLVTLQTFHLSGTSGGGLPNFSDAPWARGVIFLAQGQTLFETLLLNLIAYTDNHPIPAQANDAPFWEQDDPFKTARQTPLGYLDYLTWPARKIKLAAQIVQGQIVINQMWMARGLNLASEVNNLNLDPMKVYYAHPKKGWLFLRFNEDKALWRNSYPIFNMGENNRRAKFFDWLARMSEEIPLGNEHLLHYMALGMSSKSGQYKIHFYQQEQMPLPITLLKDEALLEILKHSLSIAEDGGKTLYKAAKEVAMWFVAPLDKNKAHKDDYPPIINRLNMERRYWSRLEVPFWQFIEDLPQDSEAAKKQWRKTVINTARNAFQQSTASLDDPTRGLKAVVLARKTLERGLAALIPKEEKNNTGGLYEHNKSA